MNDKIASIHGAATHEKEPNKHAVSVLQNALEKANAGELTGVIMACHYYDGTAGTARGGYISSYSILGALEYAKIRTTTDVLKDEENI